MFASPFVHCTEKITAIGGERLYVPINLQSKNIANLFTVRSNISWQLRRNFIYSRTMKSKDEQTKL